MAETNNGPYVLKQGKDGNVAVTAADLAPVGTGGAAALVVQTAPSNHSGTLSQWYVLFYLTKELGPTELTMKVRTTWWQLIYLPAGVTTANDAIGKIVGSSPGNPPVHPDSDPPPGVVSGPGHT